MTTRAAAQAALSAGSCRATSTRTRATSPSTTITQRDSPSLTLGTIRLDMLSTTDRGVQHLSTRLLTTWLPSLIWYRSRPVDCTDVVGIPSRHALTQPSWPSTPTLCNHATPKLTLMPVELGAVASFQRSCLAVELACQRRPKLVKKQERKNLSFPTPIQVPLIVCLLFSFEFPLVDSPTASTASTLAFTRFRWSLPRSVNSSSVALSPFQSATKKDKAPTLSLTRTVSYLSCLVDEHFPRRSKQQTTLAPPAV